MSSNMTDEWDYERSTVSEGSILLYLENDPKQTLHQIPFDAVRTWMDLEDLAREMGHDKNGEFRLKGYNTAAFIPSKLWNYFLKDGAIYGIVFSRPLTVNVNDPAQAFPTFTIECSKDMSVFDMRHRLFEKIVELQPLEGYWAPETAGHLVVQRLFSEAKIPDDHLLRDCVEWTPDHVNITVTGLVRYDDSVMQDDWILNGENIDEDDTADAEDATNTNAEVGNTGAEGMDLQAAKEQPRSIEASGVTLPDPTSDIDTDTPVSSKSSQAAPSLRCSDPYCPHEAPPASDSTGHKRLSIRFASKQPSELLSTAMDDEWVVPDEIPTAYDDWTNSVVSPTATSHGGSAARKAPLVATREQPKRKVKRESLGGKVDW